MKVPEVQELYRRSIKPYLFLLDPEVAHNLSYSGINALNSLVSSRFISEIDFGDKFSQQFCGTKIEHPIGLAAGFDKNAKLINCLKRLGFGYAEIGSITNQASRGNPKPRLFRLPEDEAIINFMGLNGDGSAEVSKRLRAEKLDWPIAINIAKTNDATIIGDKAIEDVLASFKAVCNLAVAYIAINVSCPNTHADIEEAGKQLVDILTEASKLNTNSIPIFLKISPDSNERLLEQVFEASNCSNIAGFICGNTSTSRSGLRTGKDVIDSIGRGGLSGRPIKDLALNMVQKINEMKEPSQKIIACGGIFTGQDAFDFFSCGASLVQIYTALVYRGPFAATEILLELESILEQEKLSFEQLLGSKTKVEI